MTPPVVGDAHGPLVVLMCRVAGLGKTTCAQRLEAQGHVRLSVDEETWHRFGRYGVDDHPGDYAALSRATEDVLRRRLAQRAQGRDVVLDLSSWQRASREQCKQLIQEAGGRWRLRHLQVPPEVLRRRLAERAQHFGATVAHPITHDVLTLCRDGRGSCITMIYYC